MKICYLNYDGGPTIETAVNKNTGGLNTILFNLSKHISLLPNIKSEVIFRRDEEKITKREIGRNCNLVMIPAGPLNPSSKDDLELYLLDFVNNVFDYLQKSKPDIVHTSGSEAGMAMAKIRLSGIDIPWVHTNYATLSVRRVMVENMSITNALSDKIGQREYLCLDHCDHVIALSEIDEEEISMVFGIPRHKITPVLLGIDRSIFFSDPSVVRMPIVISAGRMSRIKDFPFLIRSFRMVVDLSQNSNLKLVIIGGNKEERGEIGLPCLARDLGLSDKICFIDGLSHTQLASHFRQAKVFAGVSRHETFGLLPVEARACGTPFVVRANSSYLATAKDCEGGYFSDNNSEMDMVQKISHILDLNEKDWQKLSQKAIDSTRLFDWVETAKHCLSVYRGIINSKKEKTKF